MYEEEYEDAVFVGEITEAVTGFFSILFFLLCLLLGYGLKFIWKSVNIIQFMIFTVLWNVNLPLMANKFLQGLKKLVLFEFIPHKEIFEWLELSKRFQPVEERLNMKRFLTGENFFEDGGSILIVGVILIFLCCLLVLLLLF